MDKEGVSRIEMVGTKDKCQVTTVFCCTLQGDFLPMQREDESMPPKISVSTRMAYYTCSEILVQQTDNGTQYIHNIIIPYVKLVRELKPGDHG